MASKVIPNVPHIDSSRTRSLSDCNEMEEAQEVKKPNQKEKRGGDACVAVGCNSNYASCKEKVSVFTFPKEEEQPELRRKWEQFVNRGDGWKAQKQVFFRRRKINVTI